MTIKLIIGLGNPGKKYQYNRHNIGAIFTTDIARGQAQVFNSHKAFFGEVAKITLANYPVHLLKPSTFMNRSGQSVAALMNFYKITAAEVLVIHDELDIPLGQARLKYAGGHGGHNGLRDIITCIGSRNFYRLRLGIGRPPEKMNVTDFVLQNFSKVQINIVQDMFIVCSNVLDDIILENVAQVMQVLHRD